MVPNVGLNPVAPQVVEGETILPQVSVPIAKGTSPATVAEVDPADEPEEHGAALQHEHAAAVLALGHLAGRELAEALQLKETLLLRPLQHLLREPHVLSGWLSINRDCYTVIDGKIIDLEWSPAPCRKNSRYSFVTLKIFVADDHRRM